MAKRKNKYDDGIRWYHVVFAWFILIPFLLIAVTPEGFWTWQMIVIFLVAGITGVVLIIKVPLKIKDKSKEG